MYQIDFNHPVHVHFMGIGGISMSGLAKILWEEGFTISGSDTKPSPLTEMLSAMGAKIYYGQRASNLNGDIDLAVYTGAVHTDNPEYVAALEMGIPLLSRGELLGQIMRNYDLPIAVSGTHGKTTTTSMIAEILLKADTDPTLSIGGILKSIGGNIRVGHSGYFVTEACEYTNSFLNFFPKVGIILNVGKDHLDFFKDIHDIRRSFHRFAALLPQDGVLIVNGEIPAVDVILQDLPCQVVTYGSDSRFDYWPREISYDEKGCASFLLGKKSPKGTDQGSLPEDLRISLGVPGEHNIYNAMAAIAFADRFSIDPSAVCQALAGFHGTDRRFEYKGVVRGATLIDDYAHHPEEITATLRAAAKYPHRSIWCVFQPHTYTRTKAFMEEFAKALTLADHVILTDIYPAREADDLGISSRDLQQKVLQLGTDCHYFSSFEETENFLLENAVPNDLLITMGAGDVVNIGNSLLTR